MKIHTYLSSSGKDLIMEYIKCVDNRRTGRWIGSIGIYGKGEFEK